MKSKFKLMLTGLAITALVLLLIQIDHKQEPDASQKASFYGIKCTVAKYLFEVDTTRQIAPLFENLGELHFEIGTNSERAQAFFNQGLRLTYAFNHAEAHRAFMEASRLDPDAAMTYWGQAYT
ncbi:MAG: hypothetical protein WBN59_07600, partial [Flavobacteriaceae bacterium]